MREGVRPSLADFEIPRSVTNHAIQASLWPVFLRSDSWNPAHRVRPWIRALSVSLPVATILAALTGIVTPLGLNEEIVTVGGQPGTFQYARDTSPYATGTSPRSGADFNRHCLPDACPYTGHVVDRTESSNGTIRTEFPFSLNSSIPHVLREIFSSGTTHDTTVSNFFDIEWRQLSAASVEYYDNGTAQPVGQYRQLDSTILQDGYKVMEGLVVNSKNGGVGFRNHTLPTGLSRGGSWKEDLLWVEPEVSCVNTNITFDFEISTDFSDESSIRSLVITDRGGFADLDTDYDPPSPASSQADPELRTRAYTAAFLNNAYTMMFYNVTSPKDNSTDGPIFSYVDSEVGKTFSLNATQREQYVAFSLTSEFGSFLDSTGDLGGSADDLKSIGDTCAGMDSDAEATISSVYVRCGSLQGAPVRVDGGPPGIFDNGSRWSSPLHACAATVRASIKTVSFAYNPPADARGLEGLSVTTIEPKRYASDRDYPLWGFEESGRTFNDLNPIWGLISDEYENHENVSSVRQPIFYIPGISVGSSALNLPLNLPFGNNLPGSDFASRVMNQVFEIDSTWPYDLRGYASMSLFERWQSLAANPEDAAVIVQLLWTDLAASAVVGTKGALGHSNSEAGRSTADVTPFARRVTYDILYAIPAFIFLLFILTMVATVVVSAVLGKVSVARLRRRVHQLSPGRIFTTYLFPETSSLTMASREWKEKHGSVLVTIDTTGTAGAMAVSGSPMDSSKPLLVDK